MRGNEIAAGAVRLRSFSGLRQKTRIARLYPPFE